MSGLVTFRVYGHVTEETFDLAATPSTGRSTGCVLWGSSGSVTHLRSAQ